MRWIFDLMRNLYIYNACIYIYSINWGGWRCWWTDFVPEAIHNPVAIKLLVSGLDVYIMYICFYIITDFIFIFELVPCKSCHFNNLLTEAVVMHEAGYVDSIWST